MRGKIEWTERLEDRVKLTVRVTFPGRSQVRWQFSRSDEDGPNSEIRPSSEDWEALEAKMESLYNRRRASYETLELVRRRKHESETG